MNPLIRPNHGSATRAARALHETLGEIATGVRHLSEQADPPPSADAVMDENNAEAVTESDTGIAAVESSAPTPREGPATLVSPTAQTRARPALPPVQDLRPELAAFTSAVTQQHEAIAQALRQVTELCQSQQEQIKRMAREIAMLTTRLNGIPH